MKKLNTKLKQLLFTILLISLGNIRLSAQVGTEFWFVAPELTEAHEDSPTVFVITTQDEDAVVTISMPATGEVLATVNIAANSLEVVTVDTETVENKPLNQTNQKGLLIKASSEISVVYEVQNFKNSDKFTLKGEQALGTEFLIPSQTNFINCTQWYQDVPPSESVDIVATEDATVVTVVPAHDVYADDQVTIKHKKGVAFDVELNKGETYNLSLTYLFNYLDGSMNKENFLAALTYSFAGTEVTSNKPIAVTISDDSIGTNDMSNEYLGQNRLGAADLIGDQLIPTSVLGTKYIATNTVGSDEDQLNFVYLLAVEDNTILKINGTITYLKRGEQFCYELTDGSVFIDSDKPIYAYQLLSYEGYELGSAILPPLNNCTGSKVVRFSKSRVGSFVFQILVQEKYKDDFDFVVPDESTDFLTNNFLHQIDQNMKPVANSGVGEEEFYSSTFDTYNLQMGKVFELTNSGVFYLGIMDVSPQGNSFGYYSWYGNKDCLVIPEIPTQDLINSTKAVELIAQPNPASNEISIQYALPEAETQAEILLYSMDGQLMHSYSVDASFDKLALSIDNFSAGTYLYQLKTKSYLSPSYKFVVK